MAETTIITMATHALAYGAMYLEAQDAVRDGLDLRSPAAVRRVTVVAPSTLRRDRTSCAQLAQLAIADASADYVRFGVPQVYRRSEHSDWATGYLLAAAGIAEQICGRADTAALRADAVASVAELVPDLIRDHSRPAAYLAGIAAGMAHMARPPQAVEAWTFPTRVTLNSLTRWAVRSLTEAGVPHPSAWASSAMALMLLQPVLDGDVPVVPDTPAACVRVCMRYVATHGADDPGWIVGSELIRIGWYCWPRQTVTALVRWLEAAADWDRLAQTMAMLTLTAWASAVVSHDAVRMVHAMLDSGGASIVH